MKSYLDLVRISAKIHRKQNRMSVFCIILSVFLVTVIFGMADMFIRSQIMKVQREYGNWHIMIQNISDEEAKLISVRPEIENSSWYGVINYNGGQGYTFLDKGIIVCGSDESFLTQMQVDAIAEGSFPKTESEALITENARSVTGLKVGEQITVKMPDGKNLSLTISGFMKNTPKIMDEDSFAIFLTTDAFRAVYPKSGSEPAGFNSVFYVQFSNHHNVQKTIEDMKTQFKLSDEQVSENTLVLGLFGQSRDTFMLSIYSVAAVLFVLIIVAGVFMIAGCLNSNIMQRIEFFGMMRCIGSTSRQIMRFVRKEALNWCRLAIPAGITAGMAVIWLLCAALRYLSPVYFGEMPVFGVSIPSMAAGICVGVFTVLLAAHSPAKRASKVSPLAAVSGNAYELQPVRKTMDTSFLKVETALGIHHAWGSKRNFVLMAGSFSFSIILFLSFSVTVDFMNHSLTPLNPWTPDISVVSQDHSCSIDNSLWKDLEKNPVVKRVYGRMFAYHVPVMVNDEERRVDLISYEEEQFRWAKDYILEGSLTDVQTKTGTGMAVFYPQSGMKTGDRVVMNIDGHSVDMNIAGMLSQCPFNSEDGVGIIICSEDTFRRLTGENAYTIIDVQLKRNATDADVDSIRELVPAKFAFSDRRLSNRSARGSFYSFGLFIYGFLIIIALIAIFNIVNSIAMSVSVRMKQYGVLRAIGLSNRQLVKMVIAETLTYTGAGAFCGCVIGIILNKFLYEKLISFRWGEVWKIPAAEIAIIVIIIAVSVIFAVREPIKRIHDMSIIDTISPQ